MPKKGNIPVQNRENFQKTTEEHLDQAKRLFISQLRELPFSQGQVQVKVRVKKRQQKNKHKVRKQFIPVDTPLEKSEKLRRKEKEKSISIKRKRNREYKQTDVEDLFSSQSQFDFQDYQDYQSQAYWEEDYYAYEPNYGYEANYMHEAEDYFCDYDYCDDYYNWGWEDRGYSRYEREQPYTYNGLAFGQYGDDSYPWWNPTGLNTWDRLLYDFD